MNWLSPALGTLVAVLAVSVSYAVYRLQVRTLRASLEDRRAKDATEVTAAHTAAQLAMATTASQLAAAAYQHADRLQAEIDRIRARAEQDALAADRVIADLRSQMAAMREEIQSLRDRP